MRNRPSSHLLLIVATAALNVVAYLAVYRAGVVRGFSPSLVPAARDLLLFIPIIAVFVWLVKRRRYAGDLAIYTIAVLLFSLGQIVQYRLFTDPEYSSRGKSAARIAKTNTLRQRYINEYYDADKKRALFGDPNYEIPIGRDRDAEDEYWTLSRAALSASTWIPVFALLGFAIAFGFAGRDDVLLWLQRHSFLIGVGTAAPFALIAILYSSGGKFLGRTTPWEPVKISFLISYAGMLADSYRNLSLTRWGMPSPRFLLPFIFIAILPLVPFFALSDFGQMLVFCGTFLTLYLVAIKRTAQVLVAGTAVGVLLAASILGLGVFHTIRAAATDGESTGFIERVSEIPSRGLPRRIHQRFYLWLNAGRPPDPEAWWWRGDAEAAEGRGISNEEAWYNSYAFQPSQALFGIADGGVFGTGLGRGFPEIVPIADSDFIYAAVAEELGLAGGAILLAAFLLLSSVGYRTAIEAKDMFTKLLAAGVTTFLLFQAIVNVGGVIRLLPMTGITLPFVSHGGWSLMTSFFLLGMLAAISHRNRGGNERVRENTEQTK
ncbi:MAG: FtsW/RodA/SpoVE family cell cycle protein [Acidobacteria bacterium]|nr:FtsW/RodA/SpoVE family cell cycle protein [Acidobacteriota bacterium]MCW5970910.1 FtsW/RodA/SpoVE family cell cycle protein [Blastocatellales bacterium]